MILEFERPIRDLEERIAELHRLAGPSSGLQAEISRLESTLDSAKRRIYANLSPYQRVQVARHPTVPTSAPTATSSRTTSTSSPATGSSATIRRYAEASPG